ncbi:MAG: UDP-glucose/GDP-mannose dehydrogenase family protein [Moraxella sp.]|nr:UDP-glucose/GDP-mannose dehydrogenase family protein [Moraxella sp.]
MGDELFADVDIRAWLTVFNRTNDQHVPIVLSGMGSLGLFDELAQLIKRSFVYYVPFVFLVDGRAFVSMMSPNLWLFGEKVADTAHELTIFAPLIENAKTVHVADIPTIEFARMSIMAMLATRVSLMNELARLASTTQVDITHISQIMGLDSRIGGSYLKAGAGFGGQTLPNEMAYLADSFGAAGVDSVILSAVNGLNLDQKELMFRKFWQYFDGFVDGGVVSVWGGGYKAGSGRTANSAVHVLLDMLWSYDIQTVVSAGEANDELARLYAGKARLMISDDPYTGLNKSKALFVLNAERIDIHRLNEYALPIFDLGNVLTRQQIQGLTGAYYGVGRNK